LTNSCGLLDYEGSQYGIAYILWVIEVTGSKCGPKGQ